MGACSWAGTILMVEPTSLFGFLGEPGKCLVHVRLRP